MVSSMYLENFASEDRPVVGPLMANQFRCDECGKIYNKGWSDEEALQELKEAFDIPISECGIVCDDCYNEIMGRITWIQNLKY